MSSKLQKTSIVIDLDGDQVTRVQKVRRYSQEKVAPCLTEEKKKVLQNARFRYNVPSVVK